MRDAAAIVELRGLVKVFRDFWRRQKVTAVDGLSLDIYPGEVFGLLGPNGSGKSTTIKIMLGLLHPSAGTVRVFGRPPQSVQAKEKIGYLPEESHLYQYLTARETLDFYGRLFNLGARQRHERIEQLLEMVGLAHAADRPVGEFSKGMARRIGLAQALINDPRLIILDEPTAGLDPIGCRQVKDIILQLARRGRAVLLSSHLLADVEDVCQRIAILYNGHVCAEGRVNDFTQSKEAICITLPALSPAQIEELLESIRQKVGAEPQVQHPRVSLEQCFLRVVQRAEAAALERSGAAAATKLAEYLQSGTASES